MPDVNTVACAVCGAQKKDSNHWWMIWVNHLGEFCCASFQPVWWSTIKELYASREAGRAEVACGEAHAQQLFAHWLGGDSLLAPSQRPVSLATSHSPVATDSNQTEKPS